MAKEQDKTAADYAAERANTEPERFEGGTTTRDDALDLGVPMKAVKDGANYSHPEPEDALALPGEGREDLRGDYSGRIGASDYHPHQAVAIPAEEQEPGGPTVRLINQRTGEVV